MINKNNLKILTQKDNFAIKKNLLTEHNIIRAFSVHLFLIQVRGEQFHIATTTVNILFMFYGKLNDQIFAFIAKAIKLGRNSIKPGVLARLYT